MITIVKNKFRLFFVGFSLLVFLTACPGNPGPSGGNTNSLLISEVSSTIYNSDKAWFEVYNGSNRTINLADYELRSLSMQRVNPYKYYDITSFAIPSLNLAPGAYAVIAGQGSDTRVNGENIVYLLNNPDIVPRWQDNSGGNGFIELVKNGKTVDFVRFGNNQDAPLSSNAWQGSNVSALPRGRTKHGYAIVRDLNNSDTNQASDWTKRDFATAGGPNDVPANAADIDADGIPDTAEVAGGTFAGLDLYAMGARTHKKDIFIELDYMDKEDHLGLIPQKESLDMLVAAFRNNGINLHIDVGNRFSASFNPANYNLGNKRSRVPYKPGIGLSQSKAGLGNRASIYAYKDQYMDINRKQIFHYMILANSQNASGASGSSGRAEIGGNDIIISIGSWNLDDSSTKAKNILINYQAGTMMHELGHNLGLLHGGDVGENYKPNYISIMNYLYQLRGIGPVTGVGTGDRFYKAKGYKSLGLCDLTNGPCSSSFSINYSNGSSAALNENSLDENIGLGRGNTWVDYNNNNTKDVISLNINGNGVNKINATGDKKVLRDHNDWSNLFLAFQRTPSGNSGASLIEHESIDPIANDVQTWSEEYAPPEEFFDWLEQIQ